MTNKTKLSTLIVCSYGNGTIKEEYYISANSPQEAEQILKNSLGEHVKVKTYIEEAKFSMPHGTII